MAPPGPPDPTPIVGSPTDIAAIGQEGHKPAHERTAAEEVLGLDWDRIAARPDFRAMLQRKKAFIVPACIFFLVYYFALPLLVGYAPALMKTHLGWVNLAYLFALSQFLMAWIIAALYVRAANRFDREAKAIADTARH